MSFTINVGRDARRSEVRYNGEILRGVNMLSVHVDAHSNAVWATFRVALEQADIKVKRGHLFTEIAGKEYMLVAEADNDASDPAETRGD